MTRHNQQDSQRRAISLAIGLGVLAIGGITAYFYNNDMFPKKTSKRSYTKDSIAIVLTPSIISANLPLAEILSNTSDVVVILPPSLKKQDLVDFNISLEDNYKIIECDTEIGIFHVLKHLKYNYNFICLNDLTISIEEVEVLQLKQFLPNIIYLEQNNEAIYEEFLKYLFH